MNPPCPGNIVQLAHARWKKEKPKQQHFFGHSYTCPTPREYALQQIGLAIVNATALHIRNVKQGILVPPTDPVDEDFAIEDGPGTDSMSNSVTDLDGTSMDPLDIAIRELEEVDAESESDIPYTTQHDIFGLNFQAPTASPTSHHQLTPSVDPEARFLQFTPLPTLPPGFNLPMGNTFAEYIATSRTSCPLGNGSGSHLPVIRDFQVV